MKNKVKKVISHLKGDMKMFKKEGAEDKKLLKSLKKNHEKKESPKHERKEKAKRDPKKKYVKSSKLKTKFKKVGKEFKEGKLHSGSKSGPVVTNPKQMQAIAFSEARKAKKKK